MRYVLIMGDLYEVDTAEGRTTAGAAVARSGRAAWPVYETAAAPVTKPADFPPVPSGSRDTVDELTTAGAIQRRSGR